MASITITPTQDAIEVEIQIAAPPERVFQAITDSAQLLQWWGQKGMYRTTKWCTDLRAGGRWSSAGAGADGIAFEVHGEYLEVDSPRRLAHTWIATWTPDLKTTVRWDLHASAVGTLLQLQHSGFTTPELVAQHTAGWQCVLGWMQAYVEKGYRQ